MAKKLLSIVLATIMLMSVLVVGGTAAIDWKLRVDKLVVCELAFLGWNSMSDADFQTKYLDRDPDVVERNLQFWKDEVIERYRAAETQQDWQDLYNYMLSEWMVIADTGEELVDYYPTSLDESKAVFEVKYDTDVEYAKPGDVITLTASIKTNFYFGSMMGGVVYDKNLLTPVPDSFQMTDNLIPLAQKEWGKSYNFGFVTNTGADRRSTYWPKSMRDNLNGEYDQYGMLRIFLAYDSSNEYYTVPSFMFEEFTPYFTAQFTVNAGVEDGTVLNFFAPDDSSYSFDDMAFQELQTVPQFLWEAYRTCGPVFRLEAGPTQFTRMDHTWIFNNTSVTVGEEPVASLPADYTELDAAIEAFDASVEADYTAASWQAYADAVTNGVALSRDYLEEDQGIVDDAKAAIDTAFAGLVKNEVLSAAVVGEPVIGTNAYVNVDVMGSPEYLRFIGDTTRLYNREDATIVENADGTETWTVTVLAETAEATYDIYAKYANVTEEGVALTINAVEGIDLTIHSIIIPDMYPDQANGGRILKGKHDIIIKTSTDVTKIQFVDTAGGSIEDGHTFTYATTTSSVSYVDEGNERTWTIRHAFGPLGTWTMPIRTRSANTTFSFTGEALSATVLY